MTKEKQTVLVVDDDPSLLALLKAGLAGEFQVITAQNGEEGLVNTLLHKPDLIISDIIMPELNGWELCFLLRQIPSTRAIPIVFLSNRSELPDRIKSLRLGADDFIAKPFSLEHVVSRIRTLLNRVKNRQRVLSGIAGVETEVNILLIDLLEYLRATRRSGVIDFSRVDLKGSLSLSGGHVVDATFEESQGEEALRRMLQVDSGEISFKERNIARAKPLIKDWTSFVASFLPTE